mmetsp:Transcript_5880/g.10978  ORF Transcript_5880/g.10978 Transcript_5880/m.10978 type:complete len:600 (-) Transcript_5880:155-1954(-)
MATEAAEDAGPPAGNSSAQSSSGVQQNAPTVYEQFHSSSINIGSEEGSKSASKRSRAEADIDSEDDCMPTASGGFGAGGSSSSSSALPNPDGEDRTCQSCGGTGKGLFETYYERIEPKKKRQRSEFCQRNQMILDADKVYCQCGLHSGQIFVNEVGTVTVHCTDGDIGSFLEATAAYIDSEESSQTATVDASALMRRFSQGNLEFDSVRNFAEQAMVPEEEIGRAQTAHEAAVLRGDSGVSGQALITSLARDLIESYTVAHADDDTRTEMFASDENTETSSSFPSQETALASPERAPVPDALGDVIEKMSVLDIMTEDGFADAWKRLIISVDMPTAVYLKTINQDDIDPDSCLDIKNQAWLEAKQWRMSGSILAGFLGHSSYSTAEKTMEGMISRPSVSNYGAAMMEWGTYNESRARDVMIRKLRKMGCTNVEVEEIGLIVYPEEPELAYSPDGVLTMNLKDNNERYLLEIKCPAHEKYRFRSAEEMGNQSPIYGMHSWPNGQEGPCPIGYWFQIQLGCYMTRTTRCCFFIWTPREAQVHFINFDRAWFLEYIKAPAKATYWKVFVPKIRGEIMASLQTEGASSAAFETPDLPSTVALS